MDTGRFRDELRSSVRLLAVEERWLFAGLLIAAVAYPVWLAATGIAIDRVAGVALDGFAADAWSTRTGAVAAVAAVLWVLLPAAVATKYVLDGLRNPSDNIATHYRIDRPGALVAPPLVLAGAVAAVAVGTAVRGSIPEPVVLALAAASLFVLVRTVAVGYRVYAASTPRLLVLCLFLSLTVAAAGLAARLAELVAANRDDVPLLDSAIHETLLRTATERAGVTGYVFEPTTVVPADASALLLVGAVVPLAFSLAYLGVQSVAAALVRSREPDVPSSAIRPGQRYPDVIQPDGDASAAKRSGPAGDRAADAGPSSTTDPTLSGSGTASDPTLPDEADADDPPAADDPTLSDDGPGGQTASAADGADEATDDETAESVSQTRVFTPPDDANVDPDDADVDPDDADVDPGDATGDPFAGDGASGDPLSGGDASVGGSTAGDGTTGDPLTGGADDGVDGAETAVPGDDRRGSDAAGEETCPICGEGFPADPDRTNCPNCDARIDLDLE